MIIVCCPEKSCKPDDLILIEMYGELPIIFYCKGHNQVVPIDKIKFVNTLEECK